MQEKTVNKLLTISAISARIHFISLLCSRLLQTKALLSCSLMLNYIKKKNLYLEGIGKLYKCQNIWYVKVTHCSGLESYLNTSFSLLTIERNLRVSKNTQKSKVYS